MLLAMLPPAETTAQQHGDVAARREPAVGETAARDSLPCPDCEPRTRRPVTATASAAAALVVPWAWHAAHRKDFARVTPATWWGNVTSAWAWDDDGFHVNQWGHPYQGSLYFNGFRANGYGFWASATAAVAGSFLWECCGETKPMSSNDMVTTTLGGVALGEMLHRVSLLLLDNRATGRERLAREIAAALLDPARGVSRLVHGGATGRAANPPDARPDSLRGILDAGWIRLDGGAGELPAEGAVVRLGVIYGDPMRAAPRAPFSYFVAAVDLTTIRRAELLRVATRGRLASATLRDGSRASHVASAMVGFVYLENAEYAFGAQTVLAGVASRWRPARGVTASTELFARGVALGAVSPGAGAAPPPPGQGAGEPSRDYDYGPGVGAVAGATLRVHDRGSLQLEYAPTWLHTVDGQAANHVLQTGSAAVRLRVLPRLMLGADYRLMHRRSVYPHGVTARARAPELRLVASTTLAHWEP